MMKLEVTVNGMSIARIKTHREGKILGTEEWHTYSYTVWDDTGIIRGTIDHKTTNGYAGLLEAILKDAYPHKMGETRPQV